MSRDIEVSNIAIKWLYGQFQEVEKNIPGFPFKSFRNAFLQGDTIEESFAYVINFKKLLESETFVECPNLKIAKGIFEILPSPTEDEIKDAKEVLKKIGINESLATCDLYLDNPSKSKREFLVFVLGE